MPIKKIRGKRIRVPMPGRYPFTKDEIATLRGRLNVEVLANDRRYRVTPIIPNRLDQRIRLTLMSLYLGTASQFAPPSLVRSVYTAALAAHKNAVALGKTQAQARHAAVLCAQLPLEKWFRLGPTNYILDGGRLDFLSEHYQLRPKGRT